MKLPTELGIEVDFVARLLQRIILLVYPRQTILHIKVCLPCHVVLMIEQTQLSRCHTVDVVITAGCPIPHTRSSSIQPHGTIKFPGIFFSLCLLCIHCAESSQSEDKCK